MKYLCAILLAATTVAAQTTTPSPAVRAADDAKVIDRVAEAAKRDLPTDLLRRIINEDIDLLRGKRADGTFDYAGYERLEDTRTSKSFSIEPNGKDDLVTVDAKGQFIYRVLLESPSRRMLVTKNRRVWVDHVDIDYIPQGSGSRKMQSIKVESWLDPGTNRPLDIEQIARQATVRVFARADKEAGYGNLAVTLIQARVFDNPDSPYADAVASAKAIQRGLDHDDIPSIRAMAVRMNESLAGKGVPATRTIDVIQPPQPPAPTPVATTPATTANGDLYAELLAIEDLLTGNDTERRQGLDRLHQLVRKLRR